MGKRKPASYGEVVTALGAALDLIDNMQNPCLKVAVKTKAKKLEAVWCRADLSHKWVRVPDSEGENRG